MAQSESILVVIDPTAEAQPALERGAWLARKLHASLELFICDYDQYLSGERFFDGRSLEKARKQVIAKDMAKLHKLAQQLDGISVSIDARWDHPLHEGVVRKALAANPDFVVKDTHYHSALKRSIFSNTDWNLVRECPAPLWLVKSRPLGSPASLLAAVDPLHEHDKPADLDRRILDMTRELAAAIDDGARVHVFHAFDPAPAYAISSDSMAFPISAPMADIMDALKNRHEDAMRQLMESYPDVPRERVHIVEGSVRERLDVLVDELGADVVVMGAVARGAIDRLLLGSTAEEVLDRIGCDILIIKPSEFRTRVGA